MAPQQEKEDSVSGPTLRAKCYPSHVPYEVVIVLAAFFICAIYSGTLSISGLYLKYFLDTFEAGKVTTTGMISLQGSLTYLSGLVVGPLIVRFGTRKVAVAGSLSASVGIFLSGFAFNIIWLYIFYGAFTGFGCGIHMIAPGVSVQEHTNKRRTLAATIALCGGGFGTLIMPQIIEYAIIEYGERGSLLILGGIMLNTLPCALLLQSKTTIDIDRESKIQSNLSLETSNSTLDTGVVNLAYKKEALDNLPVMTNPDGSSSKGLAHEFKKEVHKNVDNHSANGVTIPPRSEAKVANKKASATGIVDGGVGLSVINLAMIMANTAAVSGDSSNTLTSPRLYQRRRSLKEVMVPVSLDTGSNEFTLGMAFIIGAYIFWTGGYFSAYVFSPAKALSIGLGAGEAATLLSLSGIGDMGGRVAATFLSPCHDKLPAVICVISLLFTGISCAFIGICRTYTEMLMALMVYGISNGMSSVVCNTTIRDVIGVRYFALIFGYASAAGGIGSIFCMQLVSFLWEKTGDISMPFSIAGGSMATAGLFILAAFITSIDTKCKNLKKDHI